MAIKRKHNQYIGLHLIDTYITDNDPNSDYFRISNIPEVFPGGKTAFRIDGSDLLKINSEVKVEVLNNRGKVIYSEYPDYIEGSSRMISVYVYSDELYGEALITIMGEAKDVPPEWENHLNVKWQKNIIVDPALRNLSPIKLSSLSSSNSRGSNDSTTLPVIDCRDKPRKIKNPIITEAKIIVKYNLFFIKSSRIFSI